MAESVFERLKRSWNVFMNKDPTFDSDYGVSIYSTRPDRPRLYRSNERTIVNGIYNRISNDIASIAIKHVKTDKDGRYLETVEDGLNNCLTLEANIDQGRRDFIQDIVLGMFDEGVVAVVPVCTDINPDKGTYEIETMRVGKITRWSPEYVRVNLFDDRDGKYHEIDVRKDHCAIIQNPFYSVMNESSSNLKRLVRKLNLLDAIDDQSGAGKLDLIIQLPYVIKSEARREEANKRVRQIEEQLANHKYGIAYTDGTEHITQLNRSVDNNLMKQVEFLTTQVYAELGLSEEVFKGTADEKIMLNYRNTTIYPILEAITIEFKRKFLTKTARTQGHDIMYFSEPFKLVPVEQIAEIADKFTRNEIMTSNEFRQVVGMKPSKDPRADELRNANISEAKGEVHLDKEGNPIKGVNPEQTSTQSQAPSKTNPDIQKLISELS